MALGPPDLSDVPESFSFPVLRRRYGSPTFDKGRKSRGIATDATVMAHVFPARGATIKRLQQGTEKTRMVEGHSKDDWRLQSGDQSADVVIYDGAEFELIELGRWNEGPAGDPSWEAFVAIEVTRP